MPGSGVKDLRLEAQLGAIAFRVPARGLDLCRALGLPMMVHARLLRLCFASTEAGGCARCRTEAKDCEVLGQACKARPYPWTLFGPRLNTRIK